MSNVVSQIFRSQSTRQQQSGRNLLQQPLPPPELSQWSTAAIPSTAWSSLDFMLGVGMVIIQQETHKIVVVYEKRRKYWFFPRGRKDIGESMEQAALREAYEESGYRVEFMPHYGPVHAPAPPNDRDAYQRPSFEPIFITIKSWPPYHRRLGYVEERGGEYLVTWYLGQVSENATYELNTGMPDEQNFESYLLTYPEAMEKVNGHEKQILNYAWAVYQHTLHVYASIDAQASDVPSNQEVEVS